MSPPTGVVVDDMQHVNWPRAGGFVRLMLVDTVDEYEDEDTDAAWWNVQWAKGAVMEEWRPTEDRPFHATMWHIAYKPFGYTARWRYLVEVKASIQVGTHVIDTSYGMSTAERWTATQLWAALVHGQPVRLLVP